jgi:hypothetical protein
MLDNYEPLSPAELHGCQPLTWDPALPRAPITNVQIESWRENPELLLGAEEVLVGDIQDDGESVAFQLRAIMITIGTGGLRKDFYVLITDEDTAYPFKDEHFWEVLGKATLVLRWSMQSS